MHVASAQDTTVKEESDYVQGVKAFAEGDYQRAADLWLADANLGSSDAQFNIGVLYVEGKGLEKNRGEAIAWFTKAANQGHREAQYNLGHLLLKEKGDPAKIRSGIEWWRRSAEAGFPIAQFNYGRALYFGIGTDQDRVGSREWFERAANGGNQKASEFLAQNSENFGEAPPPVEISEALAVKVPDPVPATAPPPTERVVAQSEYVLVKDRPVLVHARFNNLSPIMTRLDGRMLLRVVARNKNWIQAEVPGGLPGWVRNEQISVERGLVEVSSDAVFVHADPTAGEDGNVIGELRKGTRLLLLDAQSDWTRVQLPEEIPGWIESEGTRGVKADSGEIARVWQNQRVKQRTRALDATTIAVAETPEAESASGARSEAAAVPATGQEGVVESQAESTRVDTVIAARTPAQVAASEAVSDPVAADSVPDETEGETEVAQQAVAKRQEQPTEVLNQPTTLQEQPTEVLNQPTTLQEQPAEVADVSGESNRVEVTEILVKPRVSSAFVGAEPEAVINAPQSAEKATEPAPGESLASIQRTSEPAVVATRDSDAALLGTGIRNDNRWLFDDDSNAFTLQLFSMQNREAAESLLNSLNGRGQFFSTVVQGNRWYFLLLGKFPNPGAAEAVAAKLPQWASGARVRSLVRLQVNRCKKLASYSEDEAKGLAELCR